MPLAEQEAEFIFAEVGHFAGFTKGQDTLGIERQGKFSDQPLLLFGTWQAQGLGNRVRNLSLKAHGIPSFHELLYMKHYRPVRALLMLLQCLSDLKDRIAAA